MNIILLIALRTLLIAAVSWLAGWAFGAITGGQDANIGAGLFSFVVTILISAAWGFFDGRTHGMPQSAVVWIVTGLLVGLSVPFTVSLQGPGIDWSVVRSDLVMVAPFIAGLVAVPGVCGAFLGTMRNR